MGPQAAAVAQKTIDCIHIWMTWDFHPNASDRFYRYVIEGSQDGDTWTTLIDESKNVNEATPHGLKRWFDP